MSSEFDRRMLFIGAAAATGVIGAASVATAAATSEPPPIPVPQIPPAPPIAAPANVYKINPNDGQIVNESAVSRGEVAVGLAVADKEYDEWIKLLDKFNEAYQLEPVSDDEKLRGGFRTTAFAVDTNFAYGSTPVESEFNYLHVETLLNQIADLLDRCIDERAKFEEESTRAATLALEVRDFLENDSHLRNEIRNGLYQLPLEFAVADRLSLANQQMYWNIADQYQKAGADAVDTINQFNYAGLLAWLQYYTDEQRIEATINGSQTSRSNHARVLASKQAGETASAQKNASKAQAQDSKERLQTSYQRYETLTARENWERQNKKFKENRVRSARRLARTKMKLCCTEGGALNFAERRDQSKIRFDRNFNDALSRLRALSKGLSLLYGYALSEGELPTPEKQLVAVRRLTAPDFSGKLDAVTNQVRNAIAWLIRFQAFEQTYTYSVSLRNSPVGSDTWDSGIRKGGKWTLKLSEAAFPSQRNVRLRSISVFTNSSDNSIWRGTLSCDQTGGIRLLDGTLNQLDQTHVPKMFFGRITQRESMRPPETGNAAALHNASPIGNWQLEIASTQGSDLANLQDIEIDFEVAVRVV